LAVPILRTTQLVLRQLEPTDAAALHPMFADEATMKYWWRGPHTALAETEAAVSRNAEDSDDLACWAITSDGATALGWINLRIKRAGVAEVGYILSRACWGRGYGREALGAVIGHGFGAMRLRRIAADTDPDNAGSIALLRSLGFVFEGHLRGEWETHIGVRDSLIYGLLASEPLT
jgi:[ribosomal protein S5]-alanine N-acetyltransferase